MTLQNAFPKIYPPMEEVAWQVVGLLKEDAFKYNK